MLMYTLTAGDAQRISCDMCYEDGGPERIDTVMILKSMKTKDYQYGAGTTLSFKSINGVLYSTVVFENHPFHKVISCFKTESVHHVTGWKVNEFDNGNCIINLDSVPDLIK